MHHKMSNRMTGFRSVEPLIKFFKGHWAVRSLDMCTDLYRNPWIFSNPLKSWKAALQRLSVTTFLPDAQITGWGLAISQRMGVTTGGDLINKGLLRPSPVEDWCLPSNSKTEYTNCSHLQQQPAMSFLSLPSRPPRSLWPQHNPSAHPPQRPRIHILRTKTLSHTDTTTLAATAWSTGLAFSVEAAPTRTAAFTLATFAASSRRTRSLSAFCRRPRGHVAARRGSTPATTVPLTWLNGHGT